jgi:hypothetical protein
MIVQDVNGEARQIFNLGEFPYHAPIKLGAGYRRRIDLAKANGAIDSGALALVMKAMSSRKKPNGLPEKEWDEQNKNAAIELIASGIDLKNVDNDLAVLEALLTPMTGSPSVRQAYMELSTDDEVKAVVNFSEGLANDKTGTEEEQTSTGANTAEEIADAPLKRTFRQRTKV